MKLSFKSIEDFNNVFDFTNGTAVKGLRLNYIR